MKLELGRRYRLRNGEVTAPLEDFSDIVKECPFWDRLRCECWHEDGSYLQGDESRNDIIAEYEEEEVMHLTKAKMRDIVVGELIKEGHTITAPKPKREGWVVVYEGAVNGVVSAFSEVFPSKQRGIEEIGKIVACIHFTEGEGIE